MRRRRTITVDVDVDVDIDVQDVLDELEDDELRREATKRGIATAEQHGVTESEIDRVIELIERRLLIEAVDMLRRMKPSVWLVIANKAEARFKAARAGHQ